MRRNPVLAVFWAAVFLCSLAQAMTFLGEPAAELPKGKWSVGVSSTSTNMNIKAIGTIQQNLYSGGNDRFLWANSRKHRFKITGMNIRNNYGTIEYGLTDNIDMSFSLGGSDARWQSSGSTDTFIGFGAKMTLFKKGRLKFGLLSNFSWLKSTYENVSVEGDPYYYMGGHEQFDKGELSLFDFTSAVGLSYQFNDKCSIYGGPFFALQEGELALKNKPLSKLTGPQYPFTRYNYEGSFNLYQTAFGGFVGAKIKISDNASFNIEYKHSAVSDGLGLNITYRF